MEPAVFEFGEYRLDRGRFELRRRDRVLPLERKPLELLILLAERNGQLLTRAEIAERLWDREVFVDTEHGINTAIRKIRYALRDDSEQPQFIQTVTGKGYRFVAPVTVTLVEAEAGPPAAWEALPDAPGGDEPALEASEAIAAAKVDGPTKTRPRWWIGVGLTAAAAVGLGAALVWVEQHRAAASSVHSLAVLPLDNLSGDPGQEYFADGMTDELTTMLAKDSTLRIVSRTSAMQYRRARRPLPEIAAALGVDAIVEGSVERTGRRVHMTLQLIAAHADSHLWAESYDRDADEVELPDDAAKAIAKRLSSAVSAPAASRSINPAARDAYMQGQYLWFTDHMMDSAPYFRKAIQIQPDYAAAWAGLSGYYGEGIATDQLDPRTSMEPQEEAARRALALDPNLAEAHQAMGAMYLIDRWDWNDADREILRAISLKQDDAELYSLRANVLEAENRFPEAIATVKRAMELNPFERPYDLASTYDVARQYDAALADLQLRERALPNNPALLFTEWDVRRRQGDYKGAMEAWEKYHLATGDPKAAAALRRAYETGGARGFVRWELGRRQMQAKTQYVPPVELACLHAQLGEREATLALLEEGYQQRAIEMAFIQSDPAFDFLHGDERYRALVRKMGLPPAW